MPETFFDEWIAQRYEVLWPELFEPAAIEPAVRFLADLAGTGPALEFGIGTGRIALPLRRRGVPVRGIELSAAMAARLQAQPGGSDVEVTIGDFAHALVDGRFSLVVMSMAVPTESALWACARRNDATSVRAMPLRTPTGSVAPTMRTDDVADSVRAAGADLAGALRVLLERAQRAAPSGPTSESAYSTRSSRARSSSSSGCRHRQPVVGASPSSSTDSAGSPRTAVSLKRGRKLRN